MLEAVRTCRAPRRDGSPCQSPPHTIGADGYCWAHSPARSAEREAARAKGGERRSNAVRAARALPRDLAGVRDTLLRVLAGLEAGEVDPRVGGAMASVARAICHLQEVGDLERRLGQLEEELRLEREANERWPIPS